MKDATKAFEKAISLRPDYSAAHTGLAYVLLSSGKVAYAEREARRAAELDPKDVEAQYMIGVIQLRQGASGKALEQAETALKLRSDFALAYMLKARALLEIYQRTDAAISDANRGSLPINQTTRADLLADQPARLNAVADNIEKYISLNRNAADASFWRDQLTAIRAFAKDGKTDPLLYSAKDVTTKADILSKIEPTFTEEARQAGISATIRARLVLGYDGRIKYIFLLNYVGYGLDEKVIEAARRIKFVPATKDGRNVSQFLTVEYSFRVY